VDIPLVRIADFTTTNVMDFVDVLIFNVNQATDLKVPSSELRNLRIGVLMPASKAFIDLLRPGIDTAQDWKKRNLRDLAEVPNAVLDLQGYSDDDDSVKARARPHLNHHPSELFFKEKQFLINQFALASDPKDAHGG
jgi:hypothetical protein